MSKVNATQLAAIVALATKGAKCLAQTFDAGLKFEEFKAQTQAAALELRAYALAEKIAFDVLFAGNKRTNMALQKIADEMAPFEATKSAVTVRRYITAYKDTVTTGCAFDPSKGNGADKPKAPKAPKADNGADNGQTAHSEQDAADAPKAGSAGQVVTKEVIQAGQSEAGNNGPDVQKKPATTNHDAALGYIASIKDTIGDLFLVLGNMHQRGYQDDVIAMRDKLAEIAAAVQDAKK